MDERDSVPMLSKAMPPGEIRAGFKVETEEDYSRDGRGYQGPSLSGLCLGGGGSGSVSVTWPCRGGKKEKKGSLPQGGEGDHAGIGCPPPFFSLNVHGEG